MRPFAISVIRLKSDLVQGARRTRGLRLTSYRGRRVRRKLGVNSSPDVGVKRHGRQSEAVMNEETRAQFVREHSRNRRSGSPRIGPSMAVCKLLGVPARINAATNEIVIKVARGNRAR